jgi:hypothetical protein
MIRLQDEIIFCIHNFEDTLHDHRQVKTVNTHWSEEVTILRYSYLTLIRAVLHAERFHFEISWSVWAFVGSTVLICSLLCFRMLGGYSATRKEMLTEMEVKERVSCCSLQNEFHNEGRADT